MYRGDRLAGPFIAVLALLVAVPGVIAQPHKELGRMWTFENPPLDWFEEAYGFRPSERWLTHTRKSALRYGEGCSASFVSPRGLIMTNHHCARDHIDQVSPEGEDYLTTGFYSGSLEGEVKVPGLTVQQLIHTRDVTEAMNEGLEEDTSEEEQEAILEKNEAALIAEAKEEHPDLKPQVVSLYQGGMYQLYMYKIWDDIRLVSAPQISLAKFGGDPDNFTYPRWSLDYTFVRAWEGGEPADTSEHYFRWRTEGPKDGELTFVIGNPGSTGRLNTVAQMEFFRDAFYPFQLSRIKERLGELEEEAEQSEEKRLELRPQILRFQNSRKAVSGYLDGLRDDEVMAIKREAEQALREAIAKDPELEARFAGAFEKLERISDERTQVLKKLVFYPGLQAPALEAAELVAGATDPNADEEERSEAKKELQELDVSASEEELGELERRLERLQDMIGSEDPVLGALLEPGDPERAARWLHEGSVVTDKDALMKLVEGGREAVVASDDPVIRAGLMLQGPARIELVQRWRELGQKNDRVAKTVGEAFFAVYGTEISPDATFTLRLSDGVVDGFPMNGTIAPHITTLYGLYGRHTAFGDEKPFDLPENWKELEGELDLTTPFCLVSTNDIIGGNSGSAMIDREGRVVGLIFDGNIESLANRFVFTEDVPRSVSVHPAIIIESLRKVYGASALADEIEGKAAGYK